MNALPHDTTTPDVETAGEGYRKRFEGPVGDWFLRSQRNAVVGLLDRHASTRLSVLEIGGGHAQLVPALMGRGDRVVVHGSRESCHGRLFADRDRHSGALQLVVSDLWRLPFPDRTFDLVVAVRLLAHVERWEELLGEMARLTGRFLLFDYPPVRSLNVLTPALFGVKRRVEGNTRPYFCYRTGRLRRRLGDLGMKVVGETRQFAVPMGLHRGVGRAGFSRGVEGVLRATGLTRLFGSPGVILASRRPGDGA